MVQPFKWHIIINNKSLPLTLVGTVANNAKSSTTLLRKAGEIAYINMGGQCMSIDLAT